MVMIRGHVVCSWVADKTRGPVVHWHTLSLVIEAEIPQPSN